MKKTYYFFYEGDKPFQTQDHEGDEAAVKAAGESKDKVVRVMRASDSRDIYPAKEAAK